MCREFGQHLSEPYPVQQQSNNESDILGLVVSVSAMHVLPFSSHYNRILSIGLGNGL